MYSFYGSMYRTHGGTNHYLPTTPHQPQPCPGQLVAMATKPCHSPQPPSCPGARPLRQLSVLCCEDETGDLSNSYYLVTHLHQWKSETIGSSAKPRLSLLCSCSATRWGKMPSDDLLSRLCQHRNFGPQGVAGLEDVVYESTDCIYHAWIITSYHGNPKYGGDCLR